MNYIELMEDFTAYELEMKKKSSSGVQHFICLSHWTNCSRCSFDRRGWTLYLWSHWKGETKQSKHKRADFKTKEWATTNLLSGQQTRQLPGPRVLGPQWNSSSQWKFLEFNRSVSASQCSQLASAVNGNFSGGLRNSNFSVICYRCRAHQRHSNQAFKNKWRNEQQWEATTTATMQTNPTCKGTARSHLIKALCLLKILHPAAVLGFFSPHVCFACRRWIVVCSWFVGHISAQYRDTTKPTSQKKRKSLRKCSAISSRTFSHQLSSKHLPSWKPSLNGPAAVLMLRKLCIQIFDSVLCL